MEINNRMIVKYSLLLVVSVFLGCDASKIQSNQNTTFKEAVSDTVNQKSASNEGDGENFWYYENGNVNIKTTYKNGFEEGKRIGYYENGKIKATENYRKGIIFDTAYYYYDNGNPKVIAVYDKYGNILERNFFSEEGFLELKRSLVKPYYLKSETINTEIFYDKKGNIIYEQGIFYEIISPKKAFSSTEESNVVLNFYSINNENCELIYGDIDEDYSYSSNNVDTIKFSGREVKFPIKINNNKKSIARFIIINSTSIQDSIKGEGLKKRFVFGEFKYDF